MFKSNDLKHTVQVRVGIFLFLFSLACMSHTQRSNDPIPSWFTQNILSSDLRIDANVR